MKTYITAFPIDNPFQENLGIYSSGYVKSISIGKVLHSLIKAGYTEINSFVEEIERNTGKSEIRLTIHCSKRIKS